ncbi:hypothetical protein QQS21_001584 [Conoideocrella luteorostrata]|uniref:DNA/RNA-binding protein Alba-like domain-containing protein n=1 Tax=Conoideocrella luteorostrata TaxID=1105319 RepID=A0AAJ0CZG5_9HYPO|nr:hypothetical protein QQS21_001584 [Conoideocrella luteorostrata]
MLPSPEAPPKPSLQKRKESTEAKPPAKRPRPQPASKPTLIGPHEDVISQLQPKYNILPASIISSTQIRKRIAQVVSHLDKQSPLPGVALLHARTGDVCKMITVVEQCKRLLKEQGKCWFQYNQMFETPGKEKEKDVVEETVLKGGGEGEESSDDEFEVMASRFEKAVMPPALRRSVKSMRIFLSVTSMGELRNKEGVTVQMSDESV